MCVLGLCCFCSLGLLLQLLDMLRHMMLLLKTAGADMIWPCAVSCLCFMLGMRDATRYSQKNAVLGLVLAGGSIWNRREAEACYPFSSSLCSQYSFLKSKLQHITLRLLDQNRGWRA